MNCWLSFLQKQQQNNTFVIIIWFYYIKISKWELLEQIYPETLTLAIL